MEFKESKKSSTTLEDLYKSMCEEQGVKPKTLEELKEEDARIEARKRAAKAAKKKEQERKRFIKKNVVRVIRKEKDGVTCKVKGTVSKIGWDEFNRNFKKVEGEEFLYTFTEEFLKKAEEVNELVDQTVVTLRRIRVMESRGEKTGEYLSMLGVFGGQIEKICEKTGANTAEATGLVSQRYNQMFNPVNGLLAKNLL